MSDSVSNVNEVDSYFGVRVSSALHQAALEIARQQDRTISSYVRVLIRDDLARRGMLDGYQVQQALSGQNKTAFETTEQMLLAMRALVVDLEDDEPARLTLTIPPSPGFAWVATCRDQMITANTLAEISYQLAVLSAGGMLDPF